MRNAVKEARTFSARHSSEDERAVVTNDKRWNRFGTLCLGNSASRTPREPDTHTHARAQNNGEGLSAETKRRFEPMGGLCQALRSNCVWSHVESDETRCFMNLYVHFRTFPVRTRKYISKLLCALIPSSREKRLPPPIARDSILIYLCALVYRPLYYRDSHPVGLYVCVCCV